MEKAFLISIWLTLTFGAQDVRYVYSFNYVVLEQHIYIFLIFKAYFTLPVKLKMKKILFSQ